MNLTNIENRIQKWQDILNKGHFETKVFNRVEKKPLTDKRRKEIELRIEKLKTKLPNKE